MNHLYLSTNGVPVTQAYSNMRHHPELGIQMGSLHLNVGTVQVQINFDSCKEMTDFCNKHNFTFKDGRTGVERYFDNLDDEPVSEFLKEQAA